MKRTYEDGKREALWLIWCVLDGMANKYPQTGKLDPDAAYKNGWYDVAYTLMQCAKGVKS